LTSPNSKRTKYIRNDSRRRANIVPTKMSSMVMEDDSGDDQEEEEEESKWKSHNLSY
jgi:hypothetical protein